MGKKTRSLIHETVLSTKYDLQLNIFAVFHEDRDEGEEEEIKAKYLFDIVLNSVLIHNRVSFSNSTDF